MENPETTLGTQDTGRRQEKKENNATPLRSRGELVWSGRVSSS
jgi:hypothetical protein